MEALITTSWGPPDRFHDCLPGEQRLGRRLRSAIKKAIVWRPGCGYLSTPLFRLAALAAAGLSLAEGLKRLVCSDESP